jgi:dihydrofolate synthase/folylpolyglutamate synthase
VLADKAYAGMYDRTAALADAFFTVTPASERALPAEELADWLRKRCGKPATACESAQEAVQKAVAATPKDGAILAYGSLYLASDVRRAVLEGL